MRTSIALAASSLALAVVGAPAHAAEPSAAAEPSTAPAGPNRLLLTTGIATFVFGWSAAAYVGVTSSRATDRTLLVPFVGPFVALAARERCTDGCSNEATYEGLLVADGVVQAAAAAQIVLAFLWRERRPERTRGSAPPIAEWSIVPARVAGGGAGAVARAVF